MARLFSANHYYGVLDFVLKWLDVIYISSFKLLM